jgi:hypothetical protein
MIINMNKSEAIDNTKDLHSSGYQKFHKLKLYPSLINSDKHGLTRYMGRDIMLRHKVASIVSISHLRIAYHVNQTYLAA